MGREAYHSSPSSAKVTNGLSYVCMYVFLVGFNGVIKKPLPLPFAVWLYFRSPLLAGLLLRKVGQSDVMRSTFTVYRKLRRKFVLFCALQRKCTVQITCCMIDKFIFVLLALPT
jgi:hypothetical protein